MINETVDIKVTGSLPGAQLQITAYEAFKEIKIQKRPMVLVIPGGGYGFVSKREAQPIANIFLANGYNTAILTYSVAPASYPTPYLEGFMALKYIIDNAERLNVEPDRIMVIGFSAGGHLAGMLGTGCNDPLVLDYFKVKKDFFKIKAMTLVYPVINGGEFAHRGSFDNLLAGDKDNQDMIDLVSIDKRVTKDTPKTFIWSTFEDTSVPCENTLMMASALRKNKVPFELHIFPIGGHGLSVANELTEAPDGGGVEPYCHKWINLCLDWLKITL